MTATSRPELSPSEFREHADRFDAPLTAEVETRMSGCGASRQVALKLFDTRSPLDSSSFASVLSNAEQNQGWLAVPLGAINHAFEGDAVLVNDRLAIVFRRGTAGAEVFGRQSDFVSGPDFGCEVESSQQQQTQLLPRAVLCAGGAPGALKLASFSIFRNTASEMAIDAYFDATLDGLGPGATGSVDLTAATSASIRFTLYAGRRHVMAEPISGVHALFVESPSRFVVQPDFWTDDIVLDATTIAADSSQLPSENFLLHLSPDRNAIVVTLAEIGEREIRLRLSGSDQNRVINGSEISFGKDRRVFVAILEAQGIWHHCDVEPGESGAVISLDWRAPFSAQWRVDWQAADKLTKSWKMIVEQEEGHYLRYSMWRNSSGFVAADRKCWATYLRDYLHPCWLDKTGRGYLQPLAKPVAFEGATIVYPIARADTSPRDACCVIDIAVAVFGVEGCKRVLDVAGQKTTLKGMATCSARDTLTAIYAANQQKERRPQIQMALSDVLTFVKVIRGRIEDYACFGREMIAYLHEQRRARGQNGEDLELFLTRMEVLSGAIDEKIVQKADLIRTPQYVEDLVAEFRKNLVNRDAQSNLDCMSECQRIMDSIVVVGGNQDEVLGQCRAAVKALRQSAGVAMIEFANSAPIVGEIRERSKRVLRNPAVHEFPRY